MFDAKTRLHCGFIGGRGEGALSALSSPLGRRFDEEIEIYIPLEFRGREKNSFRRSLRHRLTSFSLFSFHRGKKIKSYTRAATERRWKEATCWFTWIRIGLFSPFGPMTVLSHCWENRGLLVRQREAELEREYRNATFESEGNRDYGSVWQLGWTSSKLIVHYLTVDFQSGNIQGESRNVTTSNNSWNICCTKQWDSDGSCVASMGTYSIVVSFMLFCFFIKVTFNSLNEILIEHWILHKRKYHTKWDLKYIVTEILSKIFFYIAS